VSRLPHFDATPGFADAISSVTTPLNEPGRSFRVPATTEELRRQRGCVVSTADDVVRFEQDIKPLFRPVDHESMAWIFDLSSYDDVKDQRQRDPRRLREGSMPCDDEWPEEQLQRFQRWTETGMLE
jgi:hypothetical protein